MHDASRRPGRRRHQGGAARATGDETRRLGTAVRRRGSQRVLPQHQPKQARHWRPILICRTTATLLERLIAEADVVVDNFRVGTLERRGVLAGRVVRSATGADLVHRSPASAPTSPGPATTSSRRPNGGWMAITGEPDGDPMKIGVAARRRARRERTPRSRSSPS